MITIVLATSDDAETLLALQKRAYQSEARLYDDWSIPPLTQTLPELLADFDTQLILKAQRDDGQIVGSVRARTEAGVCTIGRLFVAPECQRQGIGSALLAAVEKHATLADTFSLFTGTRSAANIRLYAKHGYRSVREEALSPSVAFVYMEKARRAAT